MFTYNLLNIVNNALLWINERIPLHERDEKKREIEIKKGNGRVKQRRNLIHSKTWRVYIVFIRSSYISYMQMYRLTIFIPFLFPS